MSPRVTLGAVRARLAGLVLGLVVGLGGGVATVGHHAFGAVTPSRVKPLMFTLDGKLLDAICPDALGQPMIGLAPPTKDDVSAQV